MQTIEIAVNGTFAVLVSPVTIICGNADYQIHFTFSDEWEGYTAKTVVFTFFSMSTGKVNQYEVMFDGDSVSVPVVTNTISLSVGVIAGDVRTTTDANIQCVNSNTGTALIHDDPPPDIYEQLLEYLAGLQGGSAPAGAATLMISGGVSDIGGDTRATTELLSGEIPLINAVRYPVNNTVGNVMICDAREMRCTAKEIYEIPAGKVATVSCAISGMQITGWQMNDRFICTGNSFSTWQDFPLVIDNTDGNTSMFAALNFRRSDNSDVSPSDFGTIVATLE